MKHTFLLLGALLLTTATFAQQSATTPQDPTALGNAFFKAMLDEDGKTLSSLISSDLSVISFNGQAVDGSLLVQGVDGGVVIVETGTVSNAATRQYNSDAAVMTGTWKAKGSIQGQAFDNNVTFSVMSAKQSGIWKIVNIQFTPQRE